LNLFKSLCEIVTITRVSVSSSHGDFEHIFDFTCKCIDTYGGLIEKGLISSFAGISSTIFYIEFRQIIEKIITENVTLAKGSLGSIWTNPREQKNGQDAFESKPAPKIYQSVTSCDSLGLVYMMLTTCLRKCPLFTLSLPATATVDCRNDNLIHRVVDSSVESLSTGDPVLTCKAISFLLALVSLYNNKTYYLLLTIFPVQGLTRILLFCLSLSLYVPLF
jgi:hypothetical protein